MIKWMFEERCFSLQEVRDRREIEAMERLNKTQCSPEFNLDKFRNPEARHVAPLRKPLESTCITSDSSPSSTFNYLEDASPQQIELSDKHKRKSPTKRGFFDDYAFSADI